MAWQQHFVTNMFIRDNHASDLQGFEPDFTIINACSQVNEDWTKHGLNSEVAVVFNVEKMCAVIFGTWYGGENKKGIFSMMNYWLPMENPPQLPMH
jgi:phosphoenolpyruvate carboxykinase (ATP)